MSELFRLAAEARRCGSSVLVIWFLPLRDASKRRLEKYDYRYFDK